MGCSDSRLPNKNDESIGEGINIVNSKLEKLLKSKRPDDLLIAFIYLERSISQEENVSPPAVYGEALSRMQQIKVLLQEAHDEKNHKDHRHHFGCIIIMDFNGGHDFSEFYSEECSLQELFLDLGLKNAKIAAEHEEFVARINRRALNQNAIRIWKRELDIVEDLIANSTSRIKVLQDAYHYQEELLGRIFGKPYEGETEKMLEKEVDRMRYYRDMLYIGVLQWEACTERISLAHGLVRKGVSSWTMIANQPIGKKINLTTTARDCIHEAILLIQSSDELLTDVQFPFCTMRELKGVLQALDYVFTDILISDRYLHATEVYKNLLERASLLDGWMKEILNSKMRKDFLEIDDKILELSKRLKNERIELIKKRLNLNESTINVENRLASAGIEIENLEEMAKTKPINSFDRNSEEIIHLPANLQSESKLISPLRSQNPTDVFDYFQNLVETRKMTMWPSRRIDELQSLLMQQ